MNNFRIDFYGHEKRVLYTVCLPDLDVVTNFMYEILVYDVHDPGGAYSLTIWDISSEKEINRHTFVFLDIPERTMDVFERYNRKFPVDQIVNAGSEEKEDINLIQTEITAKKSM